MFIPPKNEDPEENNEAALKALSSFCELYGPAKEGSLTDMFTTLEIEELISSHTGYYFDLQELNDLLKSMGYTYEMQENKFLWQCSKIA